VAVVTLHISRQLAVPVMGQFLGRAEVRGKRYQVIASFEDNHGKPRGERVVRLIVPGCSHTLIGQLIHLDLLSPVQSADTVSARSIF
jgi:hypothetical protein